MPALIRSFEKNISVNDSLFTPLREAIAILKNWDYRCSENSVATTLAVMWGEKLPPLISKVKGTDDQVEKTKYFAANATVDELIYPMLAVIKDLKTNFGNWQIAWGEINRFQRIYNDIENKFDDSQPGIPVAFASSTWGILPSYSSRTYPGTKKRYGYHGNSFICAVEFGKKIKAKSLLAGGASGNPNSKHFFDQGTMYSKGVFKDVLFYKEDVLQHAEKNYHPGE